MNRNEWGIVHRQINQFENILSIEHKKQFCKENKFVADFPYTWILPREPKEKCVHCDEEFPAPIKFIARLKKL